MYLVMVNKDNLPQDVVLVTTDRDKATAQFLDTCSERLSNWDEYSPDDKEALLDLGYEHFGNNEAVVLVDTDGPTSDAEIRDQLTGQPKKVTDKTDQNRPIEMYRLLDENQWDTVVVEIPADTNPHVIEAVARIHAEAQYGTFAYMLYSSMDDECPGIPARSKVQVTLSFDLNEITTGSEIEQQDAAIEVVNLTLQRQPFGLGARLEKTT